MSGRRPRGALARGAGRATILPLCISREPVPRGRLSPKGLLSVGLFDKLGRVRLPLPPVATKRRPEPVLKGEGDPRAIHAPVSGRVVALEDVGDPAFSQGMLGCGVGVRPEGDVAFSPVSGTVVADVKTKHALLIKGENGAEVLLHVGLDSVSLRGAGFDVFVRKGDHVRAGEPLMSFDRALMAERGLDDTVVLTVTNPEVFSRVEPVCAGGEVAAGAVVLRTEA